MTIHDLVIHQHGKIICRECAKLIAQCRCAFCTEVNYLVCSQCRTAKDGKKGEKTPRRYPTTFCSV